ncbi:MAG: hypothetical protein ABIR70_11965 [Bryobacteraceae bacterium]
MTLEEASAAALEATRIGDLDALAKALAARSSALASGESPTPGVHAAGELTMELLRQLIRDTGLEVARLKQLQMATFPSGEPPSYVDLAG